MIALDFNPPAWWVKSDGTLRGALGSAWTVKQAHAFRDLLREWIDSGLNDMGREHPQWRTLERAQNCRETVQRFLTRHPVKFPFAASQLPLQFKFASVKKSEGVAYWITLLLDSELCREVHICRNPTCGKFFNAKAKRTPYKSGLGCSVACRSRLTKDSVEAGRRALKIAECRKWCTAAIAKNLPPLEQKSFIAKYANVSKRFVTGHWEAIYESA